MICLFYVSNISIIDLSSVPFLHSTNSCISFNSIQLISVQVSVLAPKQRTKALSIHTEKPSSCPGSCGQGARPLTPTMAGGRDGGGTNLFKLRQEPWSQLKTGIENFKIKDCIIVLFYPAFSR